MHGMMRGLREELMLRTGVICGKMRTSELTDEDFNQYYALCQTAVATEVLSEKDLKVIIDIMEGV